MFPCRLFSHCAAPYTGPSDKPSLGGGAWIVSLQLVFPYCRALGRAGRVAWPWPRCLDCLFAGCLLTVQCHMPGWANSLALARQCHCSLPPCVPNALPQAGPGVSPGLGRGKHIVHFIFLYALSCWAHEIFPHHSTVPNL